MVICTFLFMIWYRFYGKSAMDERQLNCSLARAAELTLCVS